MRAALYVHRWSDEKVMLRINTLVEGCVEMSGVGVFFYLFIYYILFDMTHLIALRPQSLLFSISLQDQSFCTCEIFLKFEPK